MYPPLAAYMNAPLHVRAGIVLRIIGSVIAIPVLSSSVGLFNYPHHDMAQSIIREVGAALALISNFWFFIVYVSIPRGSRGHFAKVLLVFMFVADLLIIAILVVGFALPFTRPIGKYEDSFWVSNLAREWQLEQANVKHDLWMQFLVFSPLLWITQLTAIGFVYVTGRDGHKTLEPAVQTSTSPYLEKAFGFQWIKRYNYHASNSEFLRTQKGAVKDTLKAADNAIMIAHVAAVIPLGCSQIYSMPV